MKLANTRAKILPPVRGHGTVRCGAVRTARHGTVSVRFGAGRGRRACACFAVMGAASIEWTIDSCFSVAFLA
eukprot:2900411-Prymnesium_polylepis.1